MTVLIFCSPNLDTKIENRKFMISYFGEKSLKNTIDAQELLLMEDSEYNVIPGAETKLSIRKA